MEKKDSSEKIADIAANVKDYMERCEYDISADDIYLDEDYVEIMKTIKYQ
jgi:hypothetical protein